MIALAVVVAYFVTGLVLATVTLRTSWAHAIGSNRRQFPHGSDDMVERFARGDVALRWAGWFFIWPLMVAASLVLRQVDAANPLRLKRELAESRRRIAELERELGIGDKQ